MKWTEVSVKFEQGLEEAVTNRLYTMDIQGLIVEDPRHIEDLEQRPGDWDYIDEKLIEKKLSSLEDDRILIKAYFDQGLDLDQTLSHIRKLLKDIDCQREIEIYSQDVEDTDWSENWKKFYKTTRLGKNLIIKPSWEDYKPEASDIVVEIDPGMAFGTGTHETTSMCAQALEAYVKPGDQVFDIGTGSGILAIVAGKYGASRVLGVDLDEDAIRVARENVEINQLGHIVEIEEGDLFKMIQGQADLVVANIIAEIIAGMALDVRDYLKDGGIFISSGIIIEKIDLVVEALEEANFRILELNKKNSWASIVARKQVL